MNRLYHPSISAPSASSSSMAHRLAEKQRELENLLQLQQMSASLVQELESLESSLQKLAGGTQAVALVLQNWGNIIRALTLASSNLPNIREEDYEDKENPPLPETLVRIRLDE